MMFRLRVEEEPEIKLQIEEEPEVNLGLVEEVIYVADMPQYDGPYQITPRKAEIILPTKQKSMCDDVTIFQIPYASVDNPAGGQTVTIGIE